MEGEEGWGEFQDWELLLHQDSEIDSSEPPRRPLDGIEGDSGGVIRSDYFSAAVSESPGSSSAKSSTAIVASIATAADGDGADTDDEQQQDRGPGSPGWVDPQPLAAETVRVHPWSVDSGSDRSEDNHNALMDEYDFRDQHDDAVVQIEAGKEEVSFASDICCDDTIKISQELCDFDAKTELGLLEAEIGGPAGGSIRPDDTEIVENHTCLEDEAGSRAQIGSESLLVGESNAEETLNLVLEGGNISANLPCPEGETTGGPRDDEIAAVSANVNHDGERVPEKKQRVWWKLPFEFVRYCVFRVSPVWSFSLVAAAVMGFVILRRRLYHMKRKTQSLQLKVSLDDKKVSQFTSRAARLNEAFSVVRRVPVVRPSLPAAGIAPWPMLSLR